VLNMFRTLIYPSSGACDCVDELQHRSSCSQFVVCWRFGAAGFRWCSFCRLKPAKQTPPKLLLMDILMSKTCRAHKKWNKIASDIKLVFHSSTVILCLSVLCTPEFYISIIPVWVMQYPHYHVGLVFLCSRRLPDGGTLVPKHVGIWYLSLAVFYLVHLLYDILIVQTCTVWVT